MSGSGDTKLTQAALRDIPVGGKWVPRKERSPFADYPRDIEGFVTRYVGEYRPALFEKRGFAARVKPVFASQDEARAAYGAAFTTALNTLGMPLSELEAANQELDILPRGFTERANLLGICNGKASLWPYDLKDLHVMMKHAMQGREHDTHRGPERTSDVDWAALDALADVANLMPPAQFKPSMRTR